MIMIMAPPRRLVLIIVTFIVAIALLATHTISRPSLFGPINLYFEAVSQADDVRRSKLSIHQDQEERSLLGFQSRADDADDSDHYDFSVLVVSYHKTGHDLQMDLVDLITKEFHGMGGPKLTQYGNKSPLRRRRHPPKTPCARIHLQTGTISVQHAPDLFCTPEELAHMLLEGGDGHTLLDRGVKIVHLVRNPFSMAVSNYHYHAQVPTPEPWVKHQNPCDIEYGESSIEETYADMVLPTLSKMHYKSIGVGFQDQMVTRAEFDNIQNDCLSLYQTQDQLKNSTFLDHLMNYDAPEGLRLATAEMTIQGYDNGGDILRMANNIVKFKQTQMRVAENVEYQPQNRNKQLQVYTMSLDDFITRPALSALKFFDFVLDTDTLTKNNNNNNVVKVSQDHKEAVAIQYERQYYEKIKKKSKHITHIIGKAGNISEELTQYLRHDAVFGKVLGKIEMLVETALMDSRGSR